MIALILAGGGGTRLWPVSRKDNPKQIGSIVGGDSMLRVTYFRLRKGFEPQDIFVATSADHGPAVKEQLSELPEGNVILEPCRRDTAAAIGYALLNIARARPEETFVVINSDAHVKDGEAYHRAIRAAESVVRDNPGRTALIGIRPEYPETGYGYIKMGRQFGDANDYGVFDVERFVEKPDEPTAKEYVTDGSYLWNPTLIVGSVSGFLESFGKHLSEHYHLFMKMKEVFGREGEEQSVGAFFEQLPKMSIDYGILEKMDDLLVIPAAFGWMDIGNWRTVKEVMEVGSEKNTVRGKHLEIDSVDNLIYAPDGKMIATVGLKETVVVDTGDALLVCPLDRAHEVKRLVEMMENDEETRGFL
ncbi:MAG: sugar phosphate nucleotidyltransferase [Patescibacteria group bacterium]|nr:sugar phosphate nucleotidyltransferase [Patescibacteria group bacterium]